MNQNSDFQIKTVFDASVVILTGATESSAVDLGGGVLAGVFLPSNFVGTGFSLQACDTLEGTYSAVSDSAGNPIAVASVAAGEYISLDVAKTKGIRFLKIVAASTQTTDNKTLKLATIAG